MQSEKSWFLLSTEPKIDHMAYVDNLQLHSVKKRPPFWTFILLDSGKHTLLFDGQEICIKARDFLLLPPGISQEPLDEDVYAGWCVHFYAQGSQIPPPERLDTQKTLLPLYGHTPSDFDCTTFIKYILKQHDRPYVGQDFCSAQLQALLRIISLHSQKHTLWRPDEASLREKILKFIQLHANTNLTAKDYEAEFGLSYHQLGIQFKRQTGFTIKQYHQRIRMQNAASFLQNGKTLQQTAQLCGYDDYYFFIKCFKKEYGVPPGKYQKDNGFDVK